MTDLPRRGQRKALVMFVGWGWGRCAPGSPVQTWSLGQSEVSHGMSAFCTEMDFFNPLRVCRRGPGAQNPWYSVAKNQASGNRRLWPANLTVPRGRPEREAPGEALPRTAHASESRALGRGWGKDGEAQHTRRNFLESPRLLSHT